MYIVKHRKEADDGDYGFCWIEEVGYDEYLAYSLRLASGSTIVPEYIIQALYDHKFILCHEVYQNILVQIQLGIPDRHFIARIQDSKEKRAVDRFYIVNGLIKHRDKFKGEIILVSHFFNISPTVNSLGYAYFDPTGTSFASRSWERLEKLRSMGI